MCVLHFLCLSHQLHIFIGVLIPPLTDGNCTVRFSTCFGGAPHHLQPTPCVTETLDSLYHLAPMFLSRDVQPPSAPACARCRWSCRHDVLLGYFVCVNFHKSLNLSFVAYISALFLSLYTVIRQLSLMFYIYFFTSGDLLIVW